jgi:hypothetical protein
MSGRGMSRSAMFGVAGSAIWLAGAALPACAAGQPIAGPFDAFGAAVIPEVTVEAPLVLPPAGARAVGADLVASAELTHYAMSNRQLETVRGGMSMPNGVTVNFGFQQITTVNGMVVEGVMVQNGTASEFSTDNFPTSPCSGSGYSSGVSITTTNGKATLSATPPSWTPVSPGTAIIVKADNGETVINTELGPNAIINGISNIANGQVISQATIMNIDVTGLAQSIAAEQAVNAVTHALRIP